MKSDDSFLLAQAFVEIVPKAMRIIRTELRGQAQPEMSVPQFRILAHLSREPSTASELAEILGISPPNLTRLAYVLKEKGYVGSDRGTEDRRKVVLTLTAKGRARFKQLKDSAVKNLDARIRGLSPEARGALARGLRAIDHL